MSARPVLAPVLQVLCAFTLKACKGRMWALSLMTVYLTG
jgi:hypothetical protein